MNFSMNDIFQKDIEITGLYLEHKIESQYSLSQIDLFTEGEAFDNMKGFAISLVKSISEFFEKLKDKIKERVQAFITKMNIKKIEDLPNVYVVKPFTVDDYYDEKDMMRLQKELTQVCMKYCKKMLNAYPSVEEIEKYGNLMNRDLAKFQKKADKLAKKKKITANDLTSQLKWDVFIDSVSKNVNMSIKSISDTAKPVLSVSYYEEKKSKEHDDQKQAKSKLASFFEKAQKEIATFGKRCGQWFSENKIKILQTFTVLASIGSIVLYEIHINKSNTYIGRRSFTNETK